MAATRSEEALALDAERRAKDAPTQTERDYWLRKAAKWWDRCPSGREDYEPIPSA